MATTTIQGTNGKFEVTTNGNTIDIKYTGDKTKITCKKIVFIQTVKTKIDGVVVKPPSAQKNMPDLQNGKHSDDDQITDGTYVDHLFCEKDPYYNGDDKPQDGGTQGNTETGAPSTMSDSPSQLDSDLPNATSCVEKEFETCAYCVDTKTFLDCIKWTYKRCKGEAGSGTVALPNATCSGPSQSMKDALDKWNTNHTGADGKPICPEAVAAVDVDKTKIGGLRTVVIQGGTYIQTWNVAVFPDAILRASAQLDVNLINLRNHLFAMESNVNQLQTTEDITEVQAIADALAGTLFAARIAAQEIDIAAHVLRNEGVQGVLAPGDDGTPPVVVPELGFNVVQVKITGLGGREKSNPTLMFNVFTHPLDTAAFNPFKRPGLDYSNDSTSVTTFTVRQEDVQRFTATVLANPALSDPAFIPEEPYYSLTIVTANGGGFESLVDEWHGNALIDAVLESIDPANVFAIEQATKWSRMSRP